MMHSEGDIVTTVVEIIDRTEETHSAYRDIKIEAASSDSIDETQFQNNASLCKIELFPDDESIDSPKTPDFYTSEADKAVCKSCDLTFSKYSDLLKHSCRNGAIKEEKKDHAKSARKKKLHKCEICGKAFALIGHLKRHIICHTGEKQYICGVCERPFADRSTLRKHCQTHTGQKNFKCDICEKTFSQRCHMKTHLLIHTGEKGFECRFCGKTFRHGNNYRTHVRIHTGERPYYCVPCDKAFNDGSCFRRHLKRKVHKKRE